MYKDRRSSQQAGPCITGRAIRGPNAGLPKSSRVCLLFRNCDGLQVVVRGRHQRHSLGQHELVARHLGLDCTGSAIREIVMEEDLPECR